MGESKSAKIRTLESGAALLQSNAPLQGFDIYLVGFHSMKDRPEQQVEVHHYCRQMNEDFAQCTLFDSNGKSVNLNGIEYIISEKIFNPLPEEERKESTGIRTTVSSSQASSWLPACRRLRRSRS